MKRKPVSNNAENMRITLKYKLWKKREKTLHLTAEEYFDPLDEDIDQYTVDWVPKYLEIHEYFGVEEKDLERVKEIVEDKSRGRKIVTDYYWWKGCRVTFDRLTENEKEVYYETTLSLYEANGELLHIIRFGKEIDISKVADHILIKIVDGFDEVVDYPAKKLTKFRRTKIWGD